MFSSSTKVQWNIKWTKPPYCAFMVNYKNDCMNAFNNRLKCRSCFSDGETNFFIWGLHSRSKFGMRPIHKRENKKNSQLSNHPLSFEFFLPTIFKQSKLIKNSPKCAKLASILWPDIYQVVVVYTCTLHTRLNVTNVCYSITKLMICICLIENATQQNFAQTRKIVLIFLFSFINFQLVP